MDTQESVRQYTLQAADCTAISFQSPVEFFSSPTAVPAFDNSTCAVSYTAAAGAAPFVVFYSGQNAASSPDDQLEVVATAEAFDANNTFVIPQLPRYIVAGTQVLAFLQHFINTTPSMSGHHQLGCSSERYQMVCQHPCLQSGKFCQYLTKRTGAIRQFPHDPFLAVASFDLQRLKCSACR